MSNVKVAGCNVLLSIDVDGTPTILGGQKGASLKRKADTIDTTNKQSGGWSESMAGLKSWSMECDGFICLADTSIEELFTCFENGTPLNVAVKVGEADGYGYTGSAVITDFPEEWSQDDAVTYSITLQGASPLVRAKNKTVQTVQAPKVLTDKK